jgi:hypothetical protein
MKKLTTEILFSCMIIMCVTGVIYAGGLDRQNVQPRTNDATKSMIRVPGVVGQDQAYAMSSLQQAGLSVSVLEAKEMPKEMKGTANMEGKVVSQTPGSGGMAMYGTAVTIYVWKPKEGAPAYSNEISTGNSTWNSGNYSANDPNQQTYTGTQTQPQMYQQQMGTTGTTTQSSQPFQVQQYYYPSTNTGSTDQQNQTNQGQQTTDPNAYQQQADPNVSQQPADPNAYQQPVDPNTTQQTGTSDQTPKEQQTTTPVQ